MEFLWIEIFPLNQQLIFLQDSNFSGDLLSLQCSSEGIYWHFYFHSQIPRLYGGSPNCNADLWCLTPCSKLTLSSKYWGFWRLTNQENHCIFTVFVHYFISFLNIKIEKVVDVFMNTKGAQVVKKEMLSKYGQYILSSTNIAIKIS